METWHQYKLMAVMCTTVFFVVFLILEGQINSYIGQQITSDETNHSCVVDFLLFYQKGGSHSDWLHFPNTWTLCGDLSEHSVWHTSLPSGGMLTLCQRESYFMFLYSCLNLCSVVILGPQLQVHCCIL
jgi:hypothetical protein